MNGLGPRWPHPVFPSSTGSCGCASQAARTLILNDPRRPFSSSLEDTTIMGLFRSRKRAPPEVPPPDPPRKSFPGHPPPLVSQPPIPQPPIPTQPQRQRHDSVRTAGSSVPRRSHNVEDAETRRQISSAFRAVGDASRGPLPEKQNETLLTIENKAGMQLCLMMQCVVHELTSCRS